MKKVSKKVVKEVNEDPMKDYPNLQKHREVMQYQWRVAGSVVNLLAKQNIAICDMDRIFSLAKELVGTTPLTAVVSIPHRKDGTYQDHIDY